MPKPPTVSSFDIQRWDAIIDNDPLLTPSMSSNPVIREVCYAGQYLNERLIDLNCPETLIGQIMYSAGKMCFGKPDPWDVHLEALQAYVDGTLQIEDDPNDPGQGTVN